MDLLLACVYIAPLTLIGWVVFFFLLKKYRAGLFTFLPTFFIYLILAGWFALELNEAYGWSGIGIVLAGCATLTAYSLVMFVVFALMRARLKKRAG
jgi:hypothetical protein